MVTRVATKVAAMLGASVFFLALVGTGCNSIFGFEHGTRSEGGLPCGDATGSKSAACDDGFLCMFKACEKTCAADSECEAFSRCLNLSGGPGLGACAPAGASCDEGCPRNTACAPDGVCRALCAPPLSAACERDQACRAGFCVGADPRHDPPPDASPISADATTSDATFDGASDAPLADGSGNVGDVNASATCHAIRITTDQANVTMPSTGWGIGVSDFTLEFWIKDSTPDAGAGGSGDLIDLNQADLVNDVHTTYDRTTGKVSCTTYHGACPCGKGTGNMTVLSKAINDGQWHHVACQRTGNGGKIFTDGALSDSDTVDVDLRATSGLSLGKPSGFPASTAATVLLGPWRFSSTTRYPTPPFAPARTWAVDGNTVSQFLVDRDFVTALVDEAGGDNSSTSSSGVSPEALDTPCK